MDAEMAEILAAIKLLTDAGVSATVAANLVNDERARKATRSAQEPLKKQKLQQWKTAETCERIPTDATCACPDSDLIDMDGCINEALKCIEENAPKSCNEAGADKVPPLEYSGMPRCGKTTFLLILFDKLKQSGEFYPIMISFNGNYQRRSGEKQLDSLVRLICSELGVEGDSDDSEALIQHLRNTFTKPVVLLIDELNQLCVADREQNLIDYPTSDFLKSNFLDAANFYLVITSHYAIDIEKCMATASGRLFVSIENFPFVGKATVMRSLRGCTALTPLEVALYFGIPALIFCSKNNTRITFEHRFASASIIFSISGDAVLRQFLFSLQDGTRRGDSLRDLEKFSQSTLLTVRYPPCYIACILDSFPVLGDIKFARLFTRHLPVYAETADSGLEWQLIVLISVIIQAVTAMICGTSGPFSIVSADDKPIVHYIQLPNDIKDTAGANVFLDEKLNLCTVSTILVAASSSAIFPTVDGLIYYKRCSNSCVTKVGFQSKAGSAISNKDVPNSLSSVFLVRGRPPEVDTASGSWRRLGKASVERLLGYSLRSFMPSHHN